MHRTKPTPTTFPSEGLEMGLFFKDEGLQLNNKKP